MEWDRKQRLLCALNKNSEVLHNWAMLLLIVSQVVTILANLSVLEPCAPEVLQEQGERFLQHISVTCHLLLRNFFQLFITN